MIIEVKLLNCLSPNPWVWSARPPSRGRVALPSLQCLLGPPKTDARGLLGVRTNSPRFCVVSQPNSDCVRTFSGRSDLCLPNRPLASISGVLVRFTSQRAPPSRVVPDVARGTCGSISQGVRDIERLTAMPLPQNALASRVESNHPYTNDLSRPLVISPAEPHKGIWGGR